jgi:hypothetical protein
VYIELLDSGIIACALLAEVRLELSMPDILQALFDVTPQFLRGLFLKSGHGFPGKGLANCEIEVRLIEMKVSGDVGLHVCLPLADIETV